MELASPNWKRLDLYEDSPDHSYRQSRPHLRALPLHAWRWEFLRRNERYAKTYKWFILDRRIRDVSLAPWSTPEDLKRLRDEQASLPPPTLKVTTLPLYEQAALEYGLSWLIDPNTPYRTLDDDLFFDFDGAVAKADAASDRHIDPITGISNRSRVLPGSLNSKAIHSLDFDTRARFRGKIIVSLDPDLPLDPQLAEIRLTYSQSKKLDRPRVDHFPLRLRLIDAVTVLGTDKAAWNEITRTIQAERGHGAFTKEVLKRKYNRALETLEDACRPFGYSVDAWNRRLELFTSADPSPLAMNRTFLPLSRLMPNTIRRRHPNCNNTKSDK